MDVMGAPNISTKQEYSYSIQITLKQMLIMIMHEIMSIITWMLIFYNLMN